VVEWPLFSWPAKGQRKKSSAWSSSVKQTQYLRTREPELIVPIGSLENARELTEKEWHEQVLGVKGPSYVQITSSMYSYHNANEGGCTVVDYVGQDSADENTDGNATQRPSPIVEVRKLRREPPAKRPATQRRKVGERQLMCVAVLAVAIDVQQKLQNRMRPSQQRKHRACGLPAHGLICHLLLPSHPSIGLRPARSGIFLSVLLWVRWALGLCWLVYIECLLVVFCILAAMCCRCQADGFCFLFCCHFPISHLDSAPAAPRHQTGRPQTARLWTDAGQPDIGFHFHSPNPNGCSRLH